MISSANATRLHQSREAAPAPAPSTGSSPTPPRPRKTFRHWATACAALLCAIVFTGCASEEKPKYESFIYYEAEASTNPGWTQIITLPLQGNRRYAVLKKPQISDLSFSEVLAVRATPDRRVTGGYLYTLLPKKTKQPTTTELTTLGGTPGASTPPATTPPPVRNAPPDMSFPALLVRLNPQGGRSFSDYTTKVPGRTVFLVINQNIVGARLITAPINNGDIHFHPQLPPLREGETREELEARLVKLADDINDSLVILQKQMEKK
jgi:hypothetical protein